MKKEEICQLVDELVEEYETNDPKLLCKYLGVKVIYANLGKVKGIFLKCFDDCHIIINNTLEKFSKDFVTAHELKHNLTDAEEQVMFLKDYTFFYGDKLEDEANYFASQLLLNKETLNYDIEEDEELDPEIEKILKKHIDDYNSSIIKF